MKLGDLVVPKGVEINGWMTMGIILTINYRGIKKGNQVIVLNEKLKIVSWNEYNLRKL